MADNFASSLRKLRSIIRETKNEDNAESPINSYYILFGLLTGAGCKTSFQKKEESKMDTLDYSSSKRKSFGILLL